MTAPNLVPLAVLALWLCGCAITPQLKTQSADLAVEVKVKVPPVLAVDLSRDGTQALIGALDGTVRLWDLASARQLRVFRQPTGSLQTVIFHPDGKSVVASSRDVTRRWDIQTGAEVAGRLDGNFGGTTSIPGDGKAVLGYSLPNAFGQGHMALRELETGTVLRTFAGSGGSLSTDGRYAAIYGVKSVGMLVPSFEFYMNLVEVASGRTIWSAAINTWDVAFSNDGRLLLVAQNEKSNAMADQEMAVKLYDVATGRLIREFGRERISAGVFSVSHVYKKVKGLAFTPDGNRFVSGNLSGQYRLWDVQSGELLRPLKAVDELAGTILNVVPSVRISPDGRTALATTLASSRLYDLATGNELATFITFEDGEWLVSTPDGYYNSSELADQRLSVTVAGKPYSIAQLRESFYRPDLVKLALTGGALQGQRKVVDIKPPPTVAIVDTPTVVSTADTSIKVAVADQGGGVGDIRVYLNGSAVVQDRARGGAGRSGNLTLTYPLKLVSGNNALRVIAFNAENTMQSLDVNHQIDARVPVAKPALHAVIIGIKDYENPQLALQYPVADARLIAATLRERTAGLFETAHIIELTTRAQTSKDAISGTLRELSAAVKPDDLFVFFVASHGTVDEGEYFLLTSNVGATSSHILKQSALGQDELRLLIANVPATKKLVLLDTCNAGKLGEAIQTAMMTRGMSESTALKILSRSVGSTVISASTSLQEALEGYQNHGLFTWVVAQGLAGAADSDKDGYVKTHELVNFVDSQVPELAERIFRHKQYPTTSLSGQGFPVSRAR